MIGIVRQVGHGSGQAALCSQDAGVARQLLGQDGALHRHFAVAEAFNGLAQHHDFLYQILRKIGQNGNCNVLFEMLTKH